MKLIALAPWIAALASIATAQDRAPVQPPPADELVEKIAAYTAPFLEIQHLSGTLLVARGDEIVFEHSCGVANRELEYANRLDTRFCIASITKPMTIAITAKLIEEGKLGLTDTLAQWIEGFPRGDEITIDHLLNHRAGIPHRLMPAENEAAPRTAEEMVRFAMQAELLFEPGTQSTYSSGGYSVLARVLELASGKSYAQLLDEKVFAPAGMEYSSHVEGGGLVPQRASSYSMTPEGFRNSALQDVSFLVGAGSVWSTPRDLFKMQRAILDGRYGPAVTQALQREQGFRWNGSTAGYRAFADHHVDTDVTVIFAGNIHTGAIDQLRTAIPLIAAGEEPRPPYRPAITPVPVDEALLARYCGMYQLRPGSELNLHLRDGWVLINDWILIPTSDQSFFSPQDYAEIQVVLDDEGVPTRLDWRIGPDVYPCPRIR